MKALVSLAVLSLAPLAVAATGQIAGSKHDLSTSGPGPYRAASERSPCLFCHVSHRSGSYALSNRPETTARHTPYESTTMKGKVGAPSGASRVCLSCHDGTIALGQTRNGHIRMVSDGPLPPGRPSNLGTDLRSTHPISMRLTPSGKLHQPRPGDAVKLDGEGLVQCTSCHDPHDEWRDPVVGKFLVKPSGRSALCVSCHEPAAGALPNSSHAISTAPVRDPTTGQMRTIAEVGCEVCHVSHAGEPRGRLLKKGRSGDEVCLECHGKTTAKLVSSDLQKAYSHRGRSPAQHDAGEGPDAPAERRLPESAPGAPRHVSCVDCHNPHASSPNPSFAPAAGGALAGVWGVNLDGQVVAPARYEYEVCLKCHGDSANKPQALKLNGTDRVRRATPDVNLRLVFAPTAASSHPVAAPGRNAMVPGLKTPYSSGSVILCTDCHSSDSGPGAGGTGPRGVHGSIYPHLLERRYQTEDLTPESPDAYALCYKCHDRDVLLSQRSTFPLHRLHVVDRAAPCSACHAAHGVSIEAGTARNNAHLVNFDLSIVGPGEQGLVQYESGGSHGNCSLTCHGAKHGPTRKAFSY